MKIKQITSQSRRDFWADMECEFCGDIKTGMSGYDDRNFHDNVIPGMRCKVCEKSTNSEGGTIERTETKYDANQIV